jgi:hypothetical protein
VIGDAVDYFDLASEEGHPSKFQYVLRKRYGGRTKDNKLIEVFEQGKRYACPKEIPERVLCE